MLKWGVIVAAVAMAGAVWLWQRQVPAATTAPAPQQASTDGPATAAASAPAAASAGNAAALAGAVAASTTGKTTPTPPAATQKQLNELGLSRQLAGNNQVMLEGRPNTVLGSRELVVAGDGRETLLAIRDDVSGQITYHLSGLQFVLKDDAGYEAFIREHPRMQRLFVNPLYAQVAVDAAQIADVYNAVSQDPRVAKLRFMTQQPINKPR